MKPGGGAWASAWFNPILRGSDDNSHVFNYGKEFQIRIIGLTVEGAKVFRDPPTAQAEPPDLPLELVPKLRTTLKGHMDNVSSIAFSPDGSLLASGSWDATIKLWDVKTGVEKMTVKGHGLERITFVTFCPDGTTLAGSGFQKGVEDITIGAIKLWDVKTGKEKLALKGSNFSHSSIAFSPDGTQLASGGPNRTIKLWDVKTGEETATFKGHRHNVYCVAFSLDGKTLASGSGGFTEAGEVGEVKLWDVRSGDDKATFKEQTYNVRSVAISADSTMLASGGGDVLVGKERIVKLWDVKTGGEKATLNGHAVSVNCVTFSPDGKRLASLSIDGTIKVWDAKTCRELATLKGDTPSMTTAVFSPDGTLLASGRGWTINLWDIPDAKKEGK
jgi:WD40 repeat protein